MNEDVLPTVTVVTPSLNQGRFLKECLASVAEQDYAAIEHIVIDGGSTDTTMHVLREAGHPRLKWTSEPDNGQSDAINKGWRMGTGEILAWLNADDSYLPGAVTSAVAYLVEHPDVDIVYGDCEWVSEGVVRAFPHAMPAGFDPALLMYHDYIPSGSTFLRRRVLQSAGMLDATYHYVMDWDYWLRAAVSGCRFAYLNRPLSRFRIHSEAKTWSHHLARAREVARLMDTLDRVGPVPQVLADARARGYLSATLLAGRAGARREALRYYLTSMRCRRFRPSRLDLRPVAAVAFGSRGETSVDALLKRVKGLVNGHGSGIT